jgi:hypothetical protein
MICILSWVAVVIWWPAVAVLPRRPSMLAVCRKCGYSLIGNVSGICPECGTPCVAVPGGIEPPFPTPPRRTHLGPLFRLAVAFTLAAVLVHVTFVVRYLSAILRPSSSPYGHENAFGDGPYFMTAWGLRHQRRCARPRRSSPGVQLCGGGPAAPPAAVTPWHCGSRTWRSFIT